MKIILKLLIQEDRLNLGYQQLPLVKSIHKFHFLKDKEKMVPKTISLKRSNPAATSNEHVV